MKFGCKGVIDLPVKLMVIVLIISLSVPLITNAMERGERMNATASMDHEIDKIFNAAAAVHYSGVGSSRTVSVAIPDDCGILIPGGGGSEGYSVRTMYKGHETSVRFMNNPPVMFADGVSIHGDCILLITSDVLDGIPVVRVVMV